MSLDVFRRAKRLILKNREQEIESTEEDQEVEQKKSYIVEKFDENGELLYTDYIFARSRFCNVVTAVVMLLIMGFFFFLVWSSSGTYISAWYLSIALSIFLLYLISFPRYVRLNSEFMEIHAILEITPIAYENIKRVYKIDRYRLRMIYPFFGSFGFGGFFGTYFDLKKMRIIKFHATKLSNLVVIEDIYKERHLISCEDSDKFIAQLRQNIQKSRLMED